jgi:hypothetical protein
MTSSPHHYKNICMVVFFHLFTTFAIPNQKWFGARGKQLLRLLIMIVRWCNGNTADFGSAFPGSNPGRTTRSLSEMRGFFCTLCCDFQHIDAP